MISLDITSLDDPVMEVLSEKSRYDKCRQSMKDIAAI